MQGASDGWELALGELAKGEDFAAEARSLGRATAEVHVALARALPTTTLGHAQLERLVDGMTERLDAAAQAVPALRPYVPGLHSAFTALADLAAEGETWTAQRIHGDLHLGQCLYSPSGEWSLIDFEGEPSRPLAERRMPQPPVRDIAGMLRSFDYAAHSATPAAPGWADVCRAAYCSGYAEVTGSIRGRIRSCSAPTRRTRRSTKSCTRHGIGLIGWRCRCRRYGACPTRRDVSPAHPPPFLTPPLTPPRRPRP